ncbi:MAG: hypothetical protein WDO15_00545 [Bacteroidota bacterium]
MNFLAHLSLSDNEPKLMLGNFMGDFVKGRNLASKFEPLIVSGIELHRAIDHFTDTHKVVQQSKKRLDGKYGHYSGVIVDVFFDHFLSVNGVTIIRNLCQLCRESLPCYSRQRPHTS